MAYKQNQGRSEFLKTGRGITNKLAGPEDPQALKSIKGTSNKYFPEVKPARVTPPPPPPAYGDVNMPGTRKLNYTGGKTAKEYNKFLKDSLTSKGLPTGNYAERFHNARSVVRGAGNLDNISKEKKNSMVQDLHNAEFNTLPYTTKRSFRGYEYGYEPRTWRIWNDDLDKDENRAERTLMSIEKQFENNWKNRSQQKITGAIGSDLRKSQYQKKGWAQDATTYPNRFSATKKKNNKK